MAEWLIEDGIGEQRALLLSGGEVLAAKVHWPGELRAAMVVDAVIARKPSGGVRGVATDESGREILLDNVPASCTEGQAVRVRITRAMITEQRRVKPAHGRIVTDGEKLPVGAFDPFVDGTKVARFDPGLWEDVWHSASAGQVDFAGGSLVFSITPAMSVIDIDGHLAPRELALAAVPALARALLRFDLGGSIGIDFPSLAAKADRKAVDSALEAALIEYPHERTAMNGFGFVQIVSRMDGPSLLHRMANARLGAAARLALRHAEHVTQPGAILLTVHPALEAKLKPAWLSELTRRTGREVRVATDPALAIEGAFAQAVPL